MAKLAEIERCSELRWSSGQVPHCIAHRVLPCSRRSASLAVILGSSPRPLLGSLHRRQSPLSFLPSTGRAPLAARTSTTSMASSELLHSGEASSSGDSSGEAGANSRSARRQECTRCKRPQRVCVCPALPDSPLRLRGKVLVLQHPHELKKRLATVGLLSCCLDGDSLHVVTGRKLLEGVDPVTDELLRGARAGEHPTYVLFPGPDAADLAAVVEAAEHQQALLTRGRDHHSSSRSVPGQHQAATEALPTEPLSPAAADGGGDGVRVGAASSAGCAGAYLLLVVDGTWRQAREMFKVTAPTWLPPSGPGRQVALVLPPRTTRQAQAQAPTSEHQGLPRAISPEHGSGHAVPTSAVPPVDGTAGSAEQGRQEPGGAAFWDPDSQCLIRQEPKEGFVTTYEAVARAVGLLEGSPLLAEQLLAPLRLMTQHQANFSPAVRGRMESQKTAHRS